MMDHFEILIRSILIRPDRPAVLLLGHFSPQTLQTHGFAGPDHWHNIVAQFYDVPHVSVKSALFPDYMRDPKSVQKYFVDPALASPSGHELISEILVAYFQSHGLERGYWVVVGRRTKPFQCTPQGLKQVQGMPMVYPAALVNAREFLSQKRI